MTDQAKAYDVTLANHAYYMTFRVAAASENEATEKVLALDAVEEQAQEEWDMVEEGGKDPIASTTRRDWDYSLSLVEEADADASDTPKMIDSGGNG